MPLYTSAVRKAIAGSKLAFIEKYGFAYPEDLDILRDQLDAVITPVDATHVRIEVGKNAFQVTLRQSEGIRKNSGKGGWIGC